MEEKACWKLGRKSIICSAAQNPAYAAASKKRDRKVTKARRRIFEFFALLNLCVLVSCLPAPEELRWQAGWQYFSAVSTIETKKAISTYRFCQILRVQQTLIGTSP
jgi:hypothetical protein